VLVLESALTDVLCIVAVFALLQAIGQGDVHPGKLVGSVLSALVFAVILGIAGGAGWLLILGKVRDFPNTISSTVAYAFIVYGFSEELGFSGAIAVMALGLTLTNFDELGLRRLKPLSAQVEALTEIDLAFYREAVFLLKTYFFVYLGISIRFSGPTLALVALGMMAAVFAMRLVLTRVVYRSPEFTLRDTALTSMLAPKGLAAAVLATVPLQQGVPGGELIRDAANMGVLVSISLCAALIILFSTSPVRRAYGALLGKPATEAPPPAGGATGADNRP
jgi:NhaP-type Na+/H+ or K+/H+ antiporter